MNTLRQRSTHGTRALKWGDQKETAMHNRASAFDEEQQDSANDAPYLSAREIEILGLVAEGRTDNEIAIQLCIPAKTVARALRQGILSGKRPPKAHL
jgi:DNA-binding NarL/FixJ family response regulator